MKNLTILFISVMVIFFSTTAQAARIKDIASVKGVRSNQLFGYGLVIGLAGTGDSGKKVPFVTNSVVSMLSKMDISISSADLESLKVKNVATVIATASLPPFAQNGNRLDIKVSSIGDAKSLKGGLLLFTPLKGADGQIYAVGQGSVSLGGGGKKDSAGKHLTVGKIPGGAIVEKEIPFTFSSRKRLILSLYKPDFTTSDRVASAINKTMKGEVARSIDSANIKVKIPFKFKNREVGFIKTVENIEIIPDMAAKVIIDERTGTVVVGENVMVSTVAIAHGNLSIAVKGKPAAPVQVVTAPAAGIRRRRRPPRGGGKKTKGGGGDKLMLVKQGASIESLVKALNAIGVSSSDLIAIFQTLKASGALQAELEII